VAWRESAIARDRLGGTFVEHFAAARERQWRRWRHGAADRESKRYLQIIWRTLP
jgi:glutamine synthetase